MKKLTFQQNIYKTTILIQTLEEKKSIIKSYLFMHTFIN